MKQDVVTLIVWLVAIYAAICGAAYFGNRLFMYFPRSNTRRAGGGWPEWRQGN
jgi:hypothetical protein